MSFRVVSVCQVDDLSVGQMRQFSVLGRDILLTRCEDRFLATAAHCSHKGAPLETGVLKGCKVICPWHGACFQLDSGALVEPPGRDNLVKYTVQIDGETVFVEVPVSEIKAESNTFIEVPAPRTEHVVPDMTHPNTQLDDRTFVIAGGGAAGSTAAETLRQVGFKGEIVLLTADTDFPYDRTTLSKGYLQKDVEAKPDLLRSAEFYEAHGINIKTSAPVKRIDVPSRQVTYGDGQSLNYDALLLATGGQPRSLPIPGADLKNVFTLRLADDASQIFQALEEAQRAVVIGASFIGMEAAASLRQKGLEVTVVAPDQVPFEKVLGKQVGQVFQQLHENQGVIFKLGNKAVVLDGQEAVAAVELESGERLPADLVIVGVGVEPVTDYVEGLTLDDSDGSVIVNEYLQADSDIYAAGDIARFPDAMTGKSVRVEHWRLALQHGRIAACNMAGRKMPFKAIPFFWTGQFGVKLRYVGHAEKWDDVILDDDLSEDLNELSFLAFYIQGDRIMAVAGINRDREIAAIAELMRSKQMPSIQAVRERKIDWIEQLALSAA